LPVPKFLLDANLSRRTASYLAQTLGLEAVALEAVASRRLPDPRVAALAVREGYVLVTLDKRFGHAYAADPHHRGVILLQLEDQSRAAVDRVLERFFRHLPPEVILDDAFTTITDQGFTIAHRMPEE
jgi:predicted nuclease of predicted toxin-antitoxin system